MRGGHCEKSCFVRAGHGVVKASEQWSVVTHQKGVTVKVGWTADQNSFRIGNTVVE